MLTKTIVFLPGLGQNPEKFTILRDNLRHKYKVLPIRLSTLIDNNTHTWQKLATNLDNFIGKDQVYLIGFSLGGSLALAYAAFYPSKVKKVLVFEPAAIRLNRNRLTWIFLTLKMLLKGFFYPEGIKYVPKIIGSFLEESLINFRKLKTELNLVWKNELETILEKIKAPVYLYWSHNSEIFPVWVGKWCQEKIFQSKLDSLFSDKNHLFILDQEKIVQTVSRIIR